MRICVIMEGCYPFVAGGVSDWIQDYIKDLSDVEFVVWSIFANTNKKKFYDYPKNVVEFHELDLNDAVAGETTKKFFYNNKNNEKILNEFSKFVLNINEKFDFSSLIKLMPNNDFSLSKMLTSNSFLKLAEKVSDSNDFLGHFGYSEAFYTLRTFVMLLNFYSKAYIPHADLYHCITTGYAGLLGSMAKIYTKKPLIVTEHGIYASEREAEIVEIKGWPSNIKQLYTQYFNSLSYTSYRNADIVTSLCDSSRQLQISCGCDPKKTAIIHNGIDYKQYINIEENKDNEQICIGNISRYAPVKDLITLIYAFRLVKDKVPNASLYIMGSTDFEDYKKDCIDLVQYLQIKDLHIMGWQNFTEVIKRFHFTVLSSVSEVQPLSLLRSLACKRPVIATDVGDCKNMLIRNDEHLNCGLICDACDVEALASKMIELCVDSKKRIQFGNNGLKVVRDYYRKDFMINKYFKLYNDLIG